jgi:DNA-binding response OmpR family regulator
MNADHRFHDSDFETAQLAARRAVPAARLLLAEDDLEMQDMVAGALRDDGYDVVTVRDGGELLSRLAPSGETTEAYDLVISDIRMPVCSGLTMLEGLRRARSTMPVILMTAFGDDEVRKEVEAHGGVLFDKPFDIDDLRTAILHMLRDDIAHVTSAPPAILGHDPILVLVATTESNLEAWSIKWMLRSEGIEAYLGGRAIVSTSDTTDVYVLKSDVTRAKAVIARLQS